MPELISVIAGFAGGVLAKVFADLLSFNLMRPNLELSFRANDLYIAETPNTDTYIRIRVRNSGLKTARNCRGYLARIERMVADSSFKPVRGGQECLQLIWSNSGPEGRMRGYDLAPKTHRFLDIFSVRIGNTSWIPQSIPFESHGPPSRPKVLDSQIAVHGQYRLVIQVCAEEAEPAIIAITFCWDGSFAGTHIQRDDSVAYDID